MTKRERLKLDDRDEFSEAEAKKIEKIIDGAFRFVKRCIKEGNCPGDPIKPKLHRKHL